MFPDHHGETITIMSPARYNQFGSELERTVVSEIPNCVIAPAGDTQQLGGSAAGYVHADVKKLQVIAPPGTIVEEGMTISIRGLLYTVDFTPFDYSVGRKPALSRHKPKVVFTVSRGDVHDHL